MKAALDETSPEDSGGVFYVVGSTVLIADEITAAKALAAVIDQPGRKRPFHWHTEGSETRARMVECLAELGAVAHVCVHYPTGRRRVVKARERALAEVIPHLLDDGATELMIESRGTREDARDRATILDSLRDLGAPGALGYSWHPKTEPLLWLADAVCGAVREYLLQTAEMTYFEQLQANGTLGELIYIGPDEPTPKHA